MKHKKPAYGALILSVIVLANPNFNAFDIFPDCIAAFIIASLLRRAEDVVPFLAEARAAFVKLGITSLVRVPAAFIMFANLHTGMDIVPLFTLTFSALELLFLWSGILNAARGLYYLGERSEASALIAPLRLGRASLGIDGIRNFTLVFVSLRALLNLLPQLCHLTFSDERAQYISNRLYAPMELVGLGIVLAVGFVWLVLLVMLIQRVKREGKVAEAIEAVAGEEKLAKINETARVRTMLASLTFLGFASLASFDIALERTDGFNVLPRFIFAILLLFAVWSLTDDKRARGAITVVALVFSVVSTAGYVLTRNFSDRYTMRELMEYTVAREEYRRIEVLAVVEAVMMLALIALIGVVLCRLVRRHTGIDTASERYTVSARKHHAELTRRVVILLGILALANVLKCVQAFLLGSPVAVKTESTTAAYVYSPRLPWFGTLIFATNLAYVFYSFYLTSELKDEVRLRYDIHKGV